MEWILRAGTFDCRRQDCPRGPRPCTLCGMPELTRRTETSVLLWQRCRERGALPAAGGVLDQPERLMRVFDVVDDVVAKHQQKQGGDAAREAAFEDLRRQMRVGRR